MSERVITTQQLEAWAAAIKMSVDAWGVSASDATAKSAHLALEQALEDMGEVMADAEVEEIEVDPPLHDPDAPTDGWKHDNEPEDTCDGKDQDVWYL